MAGALTRRARNDCARSRLARKRRPAMAGALTRRTGKRLARNGLTGNGLNRDRRDWNGLPGVAGARSRRAALADRSLLAKILLNDDALRTIVAPERHGNRNWNRQEARPLRRRRRRQLDEGDRLRRQEINRRWRRRRIHARIEDEDRPIDDDHFRRRRRRGGHQSRRRRSSAEARSAPKGSVSRRRAS